MSLKRYMGRIALMPYRGALDGFHAIIEAASNTCLVRVDNNRYSVLAAAVGRQASMPTGGRPPLLTSQKLSPQRLSISSPCVG